MQRNGELSLSQLEQNDVPGVTLTERYLPSAQDRTRFHENPTPTTLTVSAQQATDFSPQHKTTTDNADGGLRPRLALENFLDFVTVVLSFVFGD
jgi:hypothetical protein